MPVAPTSRAARATRASASSAARNRGARSSESKSKNATVSALGHTVQGGLGAHHHPAPARTLPLLAVVRGRRSPAPRPPSTPASASRSSRTRVTPRPNAFIRVAPHRAHTTGRCCPQRRQRSSGAGPALPSDGPERRPRPRPVSPTCSTAAPQVSQRASSPHDAHGSSRTRPVRFTMQTTRRPGDPAASRTSRTRRSENNPVRGSSLRRSIDLDGGPAPALGRSAAVQPALHGEDLERRTRRHERTRHPSRRARSATTAQAAHVGHALRGRPRHGRRGRPRRPAAARGRRHRHGHLRPRTPRPGPAPVARGATRVAMPTARSRRAHVVCRAVTRCPARARRRLRRRIQPVAPRRRGGSARGRPAGPSLTTVVPGARGRRRVRAVPTPGSARHRRGRRRHRRGRGACVPPPRRRRCAATPAPGPAQRHAAHRARSSTGGGGPHRVPAEIGRNTTPGGGVNVVLPPPTRPHAAPQRRCGPESPTRTSSPSASGTV